jgi:beta-glucosidase
MNLEHSRPSATQSTHPEFSASASHEGRSRVYGALLLTALGALFGTLGCHRPHPGDQAAAAPVASAPVCLAPAQPMAKITASTDDAFPSARCVEQAQALVGRMTAREKFGQMLQPDRGTVRDLKQMSDFGIGSVLSGGGSAPNENSAYGWARMVNDFRERSLAGAQHIPMLYGIDAVHGHNNVKGAVIFPHNVGLGATRDPDLVERIGRATAEEVAATNIDWDFTPVLATARDERWGRTYEAFGEALELPLSLGPAMIRGLQGKRLGAVAPSVLATAKHFIADGNTEGGVDRGDAPLSPEQVESELLPAYRAAIDAGVGSVMVSYSSIGGIKNHCNGTLLNDTLKGKLGFSGLLVSDWQGIEKIPHPFPVALSESINAGVDMVMAPNVHTELVSTLETLVPNQIPISRIDDAVTRILTVKCELGMLDPSHWSRDRSGQLQMNSELQAKFGGQEHRQLAREAVQRSLVLLKNDANLLPLSKSSSRVSLAGRSADDLGRQCGGWTISWQGESGAVTTGTTIRQGIEGALGAARVSFSVDGKTAVAGSVGIAVVGERPYAEFNGDKADLALEPEDLEVLRRLKAQGLRVVLIVVSGRPLILGEAEHLADAIVAAWLPGSEGEGVADALFGDAAFSGKLPHTWPREMAQIPINVGDANYDPLFAYGFGLTTTPTSAAASAVATSPAP